MKQVLARQLHIAQAAAAPLAVRVAVPAAAAEACYACCACCACCGGIIGVQLPSTDAAVADGNRHAPAGAQGQSNAIGGHLGQGRVGWRAQKRQSDAAAASSPQRMAHQGSRLPLTELFLEDRCAQAVLVWLQLGCAHYACSHLCAVAREDAKVKPVPNGCTGWK